MSQVGGVAQVTRRHTPSWYARRLKMAGVWFLIAAIGLLDALLVCVLVVAWWHS